MTNTAFTKYARAIQSASNATLAILTLEWEKVDGFLARAVRAEIAKEWSKRNAA